MIGESRHLPKGRLAICLKCLQQARMCVNCRQTGDPLCSAATACWHSARLMRRRDQCEVQGLAVLDSAVRLDNPDFEKVSEPSLRRREA